MANPIFPYNGFRPGQEYLAMEVKRIVESGGILAVKAPTGFGKTAAVIYGHLLADAPKVLVLVRTVNEVEPIVRELKRFNEGYTILVSPRRTCPLIDSGGIPYEDFWENCRIARMRGACDYYRRVDYVSEDEIYNVLYSGRGLQSLRLIARETGSCPFFSSRKIIDAQRVRFIIATYPYFFKKDLAEYVFEGIDLSGMSVIVDEAHSLLNIHSLTERTLTRDLVRKAIDEVNTRIPEYGDVASMLRDIDLFMEKLGKSRPRGMKSLGKERLLTLIRDPDLIMDAAEESRFRVVSELLVASDIKAVMRVRSPLYRFSLWLETLLDDNSMLFYSSVNGDIQLITTLMDPALIVKGPLESVRSVVLMSGTMPPHHFISRVLGVDREIVYIDLDMVKGVKGYSSYYTAVSADVTTRYVERNRIMYNRIASYISIINVRLPGPKLVVYPSYEVMDNIVGKMPAGVKLVIEDRRTSLEDVALSLGKDDNVLINAVAGGKLVEGIEFTDARGNSILRVVIVVGVPFPQPDDYTREFINTISGRLGPSGARDYVYKYLTAIKVRQALGRALRSPSDKAVYILLDYRYLRRDLKTLIGIRYDRVFKGLYGLARVLQEASKHLQ